MEFIAMISGFVCAVIVPLVVCYYILQKSKTKWQYDTTAVNQLEDRIQNIENRLSDIQEIVFSIDDQLKRPSTQSTTPSVKELS